MNPIAVLLLVIAVSCLPGALIVGGFNGLSLLGALTVILAITIQIARPDFTFTHLRDRARAVLTRKATR